MDAIWGAGGAVAGLVGALVGLILSLRTGLLASGSELTRLQQATDKQLADQAAAHTAELARLEKLFGGTIDHERATSSEWRRTTERAQEALDVALAANETWARQAEMSALTGDLTNKVLDTLRQQALRAGGGTT